MASVKLTNVKKIYDNNVVAEFAIISDGYGFGCGNTCSRVKKTMITDLKLSAVRYKIEITSVLIVASEFDLTFFIYFYMKLIESLDRSRRKSR